MPDERNQTSEAERLLHGLSRIEVPAALEQRALSRLRKAQERGGHRTRHGAPRQLIAVMTPIALLILAAIGLFLPQESQRFPPQSATSGPVATGKEVSNAGRGRPAEARRLVKLKLSRGWKLAPASGQITNNETIGTAEQGIGDLAVPGNPLPRMRAATIPGEPLPLFEAAAAPGTPLPSFAEATTNGDYQ